MIGLSGVSLYLPYVPLGATSDPLSDKGSLGATRIDDDVYGSQ